MKARVYAILIMFLGIQTISCEKESIEYLCYSVNGYEEFLNYDTISFNATINDEDLSWSRDNGISSSSGFEPGYPDENNRLIESSFFNNPNGTGGAGLGGLTLPRFDVSNEDEFNNVFQLGEKEFGVYDVGFRFYIIEGSSIFNSDSNNEETTLELLKVKEYKDNIDRYWLKTWFLVSGKLTSGDGEVKNIENGRLILSFANYKL